MTSLGMARPNQLRFTLASHSQCDGPHTSFQPCPSPVILQNRSSPSYLVGDRLAVAVRLARRDLQHGLAHRPMCLPTSPPLPYSSQYGQFSLGYHESARNAGGEVEVGGVRSAGGGVEVGGVRVVEDTAKTKGGNTCSRGGSGAVTDHRRSVKEGGVKGDGDGVSEGEEGGTKTARDVSGELIQLKLELNHQVQRLRELCTREVVCGGRGEEEERERRRSAEQIAMMARRLYDLQHQVWATGAERKPLSHRKKLAAARRAATRTLRSYTSTLHPLPNELLQMVGVLCERGDRQTAQLLSLAQMYSDTLRSAHQKSHGSSLQQSTVKHKRKKCLGKRKKRHQQCGMVLPRQPFRFRRGDVIHFSQPTLSSTARCRPSVRHSTHTPGDRKHAELTVNCKGSRRKAKQSEMRDLKSVTEDDGGGGGEGGDEEGEGGGDEGEYQKVDESSQSETETVTVTPQLTQHASPSNISPPPLLLRHSAHSNSPSSPALSDPLQNTVLEGQSLGKRRTVELPNLVAMATSLQHMKEVEVEIRQKWSGRSYTEPLGGHHPSNTSAVPPSPSSPPSPYSRRSEWTLLNTALSDSREFELCKLINRLANDLLEESIDAVCEEVGEICSGLTKSIFSSEFSTPTAVLH